MRIEIKLHMLLLVEIVLMQTKTPVRIRSIKLKPELIVNELTSALPYSNNLTLICADARRLSSDSIHFSDPILDAIPGPPTAIAAIAAIAAAYDDDDDDDDDTEVGQS